jgi:hydroxymethylglutaryl-CoA reductase
MTAIKPITDQDLVEKYFEIKDYITRENEEFQARIKPWADKLILIEDAFLERLNARNAKNSKTDAGTAYKITRMDVKVEDHNTFLKFCLDNWDKWGMDMLRVGAVTEHVRKFIDEHKRRENPPGLSTSSTTRVNIRRS